MNYVEKLYHCIPGSVIFVFVKNGIKHIMFVGRVEQIIFESNGNVEIRLEGDNEFITQRFKNISDICFSTEEALERLKELNGRSND